MRPSWSVNLLAALLAVSWPLRAGREEDERRRAAAVRQARDLMEARGKALDALRALEGARVRDEGARVELLIPRRCFFSGHDPEPSVSGAAALASLKDFLTTFHTPHLLVSWSSAPDDTPEAVRLGARRTVALGFRLLKDCGLAPERLFVRTRTEPAGNVRFLVSTVRPRPEELDREFQPVLVHAQRREIESGGEAAPLDVILLDPARVKRWRLQILSPEGGVVRRFEGEQDVYASRSWDVKDAGGRPAAPGLYQALLTAETWSSQMRTDSVALAVRRPAGIAAVPPPPPAKTPAAGDGKDVAKWFHAVVFEAGRDEIPGPMFLAVEQAARALRLYPGRKAAVEGFSAAEERDAAGLAARRAAKVRDLLIQKHGLAAGRILAKGNAPRVPLEGEIMNKALIFFLE